MSRYLYVTRLYRLNQISNRTRNENRGEWRDVIHYSYRPCYPIMDLWNPSKEARSGSIDIYSIMLLLSLLNTNSLFRYSLKKISCHCSKIRYEKLCICFCDGSYKTLSNRLDKNHTTFILDSRTLVCAQMMGHNAVEPVQLMTRMKAPKAFKESSINRLQCTKVSSDVARLAISWGPNEILHYSTILEMWELEHMYMHLKRQSNDSDSLFRQSYITDYDTLV